MEWADLSDAKLESRYRATVKLYKEDIKQLRITKKGIPHKGDAAAIRLGAMLIRIMAQEKRRRQHA